MWNHSLKVLGLGPSAEFACMHACLPAWLPSAVQEHAREDYHPLVSVCERPSGVFL